MIERVDPQLQNIVNNELEAGEKLWWTGQPEPSRIARGALPILFFAIPWTAFACFWVVMASMGVNRAHAPGPMLFFPLFGLPFILIGLVMLISPLTIYWQAKGTIYAVTNKRALTIRGSARSGKAVLSYYGADFGNIDRVEYAPNKGDLIWAAGPIALGRSSGATAQIFGSSVRINPAIPKQLSYGRGGTGLGLNGFYGIDNPHEVEKLLRQLADSKKDGLANEDT